MNPILKKKCSLHILMEGAGRTKVETETKKSFQKAISQYWLNIKCILKYLNGTFLVSTKLNFTISIFKLGNYFDYWFSWIVFSDIK